MFVLVIARIARTLTLACAACGVFAACDGKLGTSGGASDGSGNMGRPLENDPNGPRAGVGSDAAGDRDGTRADGGRSGTSGGDDGSGGASPTNGGSDTAPDVPAPGARFVRLTHTQWENAVVDLLYLETGDTYACLLREDPKQGGFVFDNDADALVVDGALWSGYQQAAATLAEYVAGDAGRLSKVAPEDGDAGARRNAFIDDFGLRAHRRPLAAEDRAAYRSLFDMGPSLYDGMDDFSAGARLVIETELQSPMFLYRGEMGPRREGWGRSA